MMMRLPFKSTSLVPLSGKDPAREMVEVPRYYLYLVMLQLEKWLKYLVITFIW